VKLKRLHHAVRQVARHASVSGLLRSMAEWPWLRSLETVKYDTMPCKCQSNGACGGSGMCCRSKLDAFQREVMEYVVHWPPPNERAFQ